MPFLDLGQAGLAEPAAADVHLLADGVGDAGLDAVPVAEAEARLAVADDGVAEPGAAQLVAVEAEVVPVLVVGRAYVARARRPRARPRATRRRARHLVGGHHRPHQLPRVRDHERAGADVPHGRSEAEPVAALAGAPGWRSSRSLGVSWSRSGSSAGAAGRARRGGADDAGTRQRARSGPASASIAASA